jgi:hypothetical protein
MVLAFVALVALANGLLAGIGGWFGYPDLSFQAVIGAIFRPVMWLMGVPWEESAVVGGLFGSKIVLNEFVAFIDLGKAQGDDVAGGGRDRDLCALRFRQFQLDRDPDGGDGRPRARTSAR